MNTQNDQYIEIDLKKIITCIFLFIKDYKYIIILLPLIFLTVSKLIPVKNYFYEEISININSMSKYHDFQKEFNYLKNNNDLFINLKSSSSYQNNSVFNIPNNFLITISQNTKDKNLKDKLNIIINELISLKKKSLDQEIFKLSEEFDFNIRITKKKLTLNNEITKEKIRKLKAIKNSSDIRNYEVIGLNIDIEKLDNDLENSMKVIHIIDNILKINKNEIEINPLSKTYIEDKTCEYIHGYYGYSDCVLAYEKLFNIILLRDEIKLINNELFKNAEYNVIESNIRKFQRDIIAILIGFIFAIFIGLIKRKIKN